MFCWLVVMRLRHPWLVGPDVRLRRRVFGATPIDVHRLIGMLVRTGGWGTAELEILGVVSAAQPMDDAPLLDVRSDLLPPPRPTWAVPRVVPVPVRDPMPAPASAPRVQPFATPPPTRPARQRAGMRMVLDPCPAFSEPPCGWGADRRTASARHEREEPHHDGTRTNEGWPKALAFGPDVLATDVEIDPNEVFVFGARHDATPFFDRTLRDFRKRAARWHR